MPHYRQFVRINALEIPTWISSLSNPSMQVARQHPLVVPSTRPNSLYLRATSSPAGALPVSCKPIQRILGIVVSLTVFDLVRHARLAFVVCSRRSSCTPLVCKRRPKTMCFVLVDIACLVPNRHHLWKFWTDSPVYTLQRKRPIENVSPASCSGGK